MKKIFKLFFYLFLLVFFIIALLPKEAIYNYFEHKLLMQKIIISNEQRNEKLLSLDINNAKIYYEGINVANVEKASFLGLLLYNDINISNVRVLKSLSNIIPSSIKTINIKYTILDYEHIYIKSSGAFGNLSGTLNILNRKLVLELEASSIMKRNYNKLLRNMKLKNGKYLWEKNL